MDELQINNTMTYHEKYLYCGQSPSSMAWHLFKAHKTAVTVKSKRTIENAFPFLFKTKINDIGKDLDENFQPKPFYNN